jgi:hypothetical protein
MRLKRPAAGHHGPPRVRSLTRHAERHGSGPAGRMQAGRIGAVFTQELAFVHGLVTRRWAWRKRRHRAPDPTGHADDER